METYKVKRVLLAGMWFVPRDGVIYIDGDSIGWFTADGGRIAAKRRAVDALETPPPAKGEQEAENEQGDPILLAPCAAECEAQE